MRVRADIGRAKRELSFDPHGHDPSVVSASGCPLDIFAARSALLLARPRKRFFDYALGAPCAAPQSGAGADGLTECSREMTLIEEPASLGNLHEGFVGI